MSTSASALLEKSITQVPARRAPFMDAVVQNVEKYVGLLLGADPENHRNFKAIDRDVYTTAVNFQIGNLTCCLQITAVSMYPHFYWLLAGNGRIVYPDVIAENALQFAADLGAEIGMEEQEIREKLQLP